MARARDQVRSSDVTFWGIVALVCGAVAVLSANISALVPQNLLAGLHASRLDGATLNQLRADVATLQADQGRLARDAATLNSRFVLAEQQNGTIARRVGAIEVSLPDAIEARNQLDTSDVTASIGNGTTTYDTNGGSVSVQQTPMPGEAEPTAQPAMPPVALAPPGNVVTPGTLGIALGRPIAAADATTAWRTLQGKIGMLLIGLQPLLADSIDGNGERLVAGPLDDGAAATLCREITRVGIDCTVMRYVGAPLAD